MSVYGQVFSEWTKKLERLVQDNFRKVPQVQVKMMDLGRLDLIPSRKRLAGVAGRSGDRRLAGEGPRLLSLARKSVHIELPLHSALRSEKSRNVYTRIVSELITQAVQDLWSPRSSP